MLQNKRYKISVTKKMIYKILVHKIVWHKKFRVTNYFTKTLIEIIWEYKYGDWLSNNNWYFYFYFKITQWFCNKNIGDILKYKKNEYDVTISKSYKDFEIQK